MRKFSTVIVSNRLPVSVKKDGDKLIFSPSDGGLATAVSALDVDDMVWVGWPGIAADDLTDEDKRQITQELKKSGCAPVFLTQAQIALFYEGYSNDTLWPLFHYVELYMVNKPQYWRAYKDVNRLYRDAVTRVAAEESRIWVHDYQLMLLPGLLREKLPRTLIGYFHHIPFPSYEMFRLLPERREIVTGLLGADLIGFHIYDYARHFLSSCLRLLGVPNEYGTMHIDGRLVRVDSFPISIDYQRFVDMSRVATTEDSYQALRRTYGDQKVIFSIDRLDYSKGILERLEGYRQFLEDNPRFIGHVVLVMVVSPSRTGVETYQQLQVKIEQTISRINGEFGSSGWMPIVYQFQTLPLEQIVPLYMAADVMLVTPRRDGMNLVAKEFVAAKGSLPGVLILSEMTGAIDELPEALSINPNDTPAIASAIKQALIMPKKQQRERLAAMQRRIKEYPVARWSQDFLDTLEKVRLQQVAAAILDLQGDELQRLTQRFCTARQRLIVLDYDGTLQTFKSSPSPSAATPSRRLYALLTRLAATPHTRACIVSGRTKEALDLWFGDTSIELVAEHGAWVKRGKTWRKYAPDYEQARDVIKPILEDYTSRTPGARIEQKDFASVWHYRNAALELGLVRAYNIRHELKAALSGYDAEVYTGSMIVEVKPSGVTKQAAFERLLQRQAAEFILIAGDDYTDEDMFAVAPDSAYSIKVGPGETRARYRVVDVAAMIDVLERIDACPES